MNRIPSLRSVSLSSRFVSTLALVVLFFALLVSYPWSVLTIGTVAYLACLPLGWMSYREYQRKDAAAAAAAAPADASYLHESALDRGVDENRPPRLN